jgi:hypothetical protein
MTLRTAIIVLCGLLVATAIESVLVGWGGWLPIGIEAAVLLALIVFERSRYQPRLKSAPAEFRPTGERFEDPTTGESLQVFENPQTGERDYRPAS